MLLASARTVGLMRQGEEKVGLYTAAWTWRETEGAELTVWFTTWSG